MECSFLQNETSDLQLMPEEKGVQNFEKHDLLQIISWRWISWWHQMNKTLRIMSP